ncbi:hypothetical protein MCEGE14_00374 [Burkholderiaceae bacterium]
MALMKTKKPTRPFAPEHLFSPSTANVMAISPLKASIALGVFVAYAATCSLAQGQVNNNTASSTPSVDSTLVSTAVPTSIRTTFENWRLPNGQNAGMLGLNLLFDVHPNFKLGMASYGALTGEQGGLMTMGLAGEYQYDISPSWRVRTGLFVGGGGGAAGYALTGNGFMFRADAGLTYLTQGYGNIGVGVSWITFPSGDIRSTQPYLMYEYPFDTLIWQGWQRPAGQSGTATQNTLLDTSNTTRRQEIGLTWSRYSVPSSVINAQGAKQANIDLAGVRWTSYLNDRWYMSVQADGSYTASTSGYVQILGGIGYRLPLGASTGLKVYGLAGPGGAGNAVVSTGGGLLLGGGIALQQMLTDRWGIEIGVGGAKATTGEFKAWNYGITLSYAFGLANASSAATHNSLSQQDGASAPLRLRLMNATFLQADDQWRNNDSNTSINNLGFGLDYFLNDRAYITGQGLVAYTGNSQNGSVTAAMELTGLLGAGWLQPISRDWYVMAEGLLGASAGGNLDTGRGGVWQLNAGVGYRLTKDLDLTLSGGRMQAFDGQFKANTITVGLGYRFGLANR